MPGVGYVATPGPGGVACTGWGEHILRVALATRALIALEGGAGPRMPPARRSGSWSARCVGVPGSSCSTGTAEVGLAHSTLCLAHAYRRTGMAEAVGGTEPAKT